MIDCEDIEFDELDIYSFNSVDLMLEDGELSPLEAGFMRGYIKAL